MDIWDWYQERLWLERTMAEEIKLWDLRSELWNDKPLDLGDKLFSQMPPSLGPDGYISPVSPPQGESEDVLRGGECGS